MLFQSSTLGNRHHGTTVGVPACLLSSQRHLRREHGALPFSLQSFKPMFPAPRELGKMASLEQARQKPACFKDLEEVSEVGVQSQLWPVSVGSSR